MGEKETRATLILWRRNIEISEKKKHVEHLGYDVLQGYKINIAHGARHEEVKDGKNHLYTLRTSPSLIPHA